MVNFTQSPQKPHIGSTDILAERDCLDDLPRTQYHFIRWKLQKMAMQDEIWSVTPTQSLLDQPRWQLNLTYSLACSNSKLQHFKQRHNHSFIQSFIPRPLYSSPHLHSSHWSNQHSCGQKEERFSPHVVAICQTGDQTSPQITTLANADANTTSLACFLTSHPRSNGDAIARRLPPPTPPGHQP